MKMSNFVFTYEYSPADWTISKRGGYDPFAYPFPWLYIDADTLKRVAEENGYAIEVVAEGEHYDYLAIITKRQ